MADLIGKEARVSARVSPVSLGEVILAVRGGTETYFAYSADEATYEPGQRVLVVDEAPGRMLYVAAR